MELRRRYGVAATIDGVILIDAASATGAFRTNPTLATGDVKVSKDGGAFANISNAAANPVATPAGGRSLLVSLTATEMSARHVVVQFVDAAGAEWADQQIVIDTWGDLVRAGLCQASGSTTTAILDSSASATDNNYFGLPIAFYELNGTGIVHHAVITGYVGSSKTATFAPAAGFSPVATTVFEIGRGAANIGAVGGVGATVAATVPATLAAGAITSASFATGAINNNAIAADAISDAKVASDVTIAQVTGPVGSVAAGGITANSFAADAITAAKIAPGAIDAATFAAGAIDAAAIATDAITATKIAAAALTSAKFAAGAIDVSSWGGVAVSQLLNTQLTGFSFPMRLKTDNTLATGKTLTAQRSINGGAFAACANTPAEIGTTGIYQLTLAAADTNGAEVTYLFHATDNTCHDQVYTMITKVTAT